MVDDLDDDDCALLEFDPNLPLDQYVDALERARAKGRAIKHHLDSVINVEWQRCLEVICYSQDGAEKLRLARAGLRLIDLWCCVYRIDPRTDQQVVGAQPTPIEFDLSSVASLVSGLEVGPSQNEWIALEYRDLALALLGLRPPPDDAIEHWGTGKNDTN